MSNKYDDHLQVLPEDDANRQIVNGFRLNLDGQGDRRVQPLPPARGWPNVLNTLREETFARDLSNFPKRHVLLLIDFDGQVDERMRRFTDLRDALPQAARDRIYMLGSLENPEKLRVQCGQSFESIGKSLASECRSQQLGGLWMNDALKHNSTEVQRLAAQVRSFLF